MPRYRVSSRTESQYYQPTPPTEGSPNGGSVLATSASVQLQPVDAAGADITGGAMSQITVPFPTAADAAPFTVGSFVNITVEAPLV